MSTDFGPLEFPTMVRIVNAKQYLSLQACNNLSPISGQATCLMTQLEGVQQVVWVTVAI